MLPSGTADARTRQILTVLQGQGAGLTRQEIQSSAGLEGVDVQAVRRLLAQLVRAGQARVEGQTKARLYFLAVAPPGPGTVDSARRPPREEPAAPAPVPARSQPVGHQPGFLEAYHPDRAPYLAPELRARLSAQEGGAGDVPPGPYSRAQRRRLLADLAWVAARAEGAGFPLREVERTVDRGAPPPGLAPRGLQVLLNTLGAVEFLLASGLALAPDLTTLRNLSALLTENLLADPDDEGRLRSRAVPVPGSAYRPPDQPWVIAQGFARILGTAQAIPDPFEQSFFLLVHLAYLHPFPAANAAAALLAAAIPLIRLERAPATWVEVPPEALALALRALCEQTRVDPLRDLFVSACAASAERHRAAARPGPDPFRLRFRGELRALVREAVLGGDAPAAASERFQGFARARLAPEDRPGFLAAAEAELAALHDGNFARYQLRPSEFAAWKARVPRPGRAF
jgi:hypothetical protein